MLAVSITAAPRRFHIMKKGGDHSTTALRNSEFGMQDLEFVKHRLWTPSLLPGISLNAVMKRLHLVGVPTETRSARSSAGTDDRRGLFFAELLDDRLHLRRRVHHEEVRLGRDHL